jgi:hypothetical protein
VVPGRAYDVAIDVEEEEAGELGVIDLGGAEERIGHVGVH